MNTHTPQQWAALSSVFGAGEEFDWFGRDSNGHLAVFTSAGAGAIPPAIWSFPSQHNDLVSHLESRQPRGFQRLWIGDGNHAEWDDLASIGLYAFDFIDVHRIHAHGGYDLISKPVRPLCCHELSPEITTWLPLLSITFKDATFVSNDVITAATNVRE